MPILMDKNSITIPREAVQTRGGLVILGLEEYKRFLKSEIEKEYIDKIVGEGLSEERKKKTESLGAFLKREFPELYENYRH